MTPFTAFAVLLALAMPPEARARPMASPAWSALDLSGPLRAFLETGRWDRTPGGFRIVALSFLADGCVAQAQRDPARREAALTCVDRCLELAEATRSAPQGPDPSDDGLWLSHYHLLLGARDRLAPCRDARKHEAVAQALARRILREPTRHVPSYRAVSYRWPADQAATLASLARFDRAHGAHLSDEPAQAWRAYVLEHAMDVRLGLPWSEATGKAPGARAPRGCALSWQTRYLHEFDDELATRWWRQYKATFLVDRLALVGFREWPPGRERPADVDSGPIVQGVGAAATALAIGAARSMGEDDLASRLESTAGMVGAVIGLSAEARRSAHTVLAEAIRYVGAQVRR